MVFRNLRERFGIDDQDYQVRGCLGTGMFRDEGVRKSQDRQGAECQWSLSISLSKLTPVLADRASGASGASEGA